MPRLHVKNVARIQVVSTCIHLYPRVEHCLELVSVYIYPSVDGYKLLVRTTCIRLHVKKVKKVVELYSASS